MRVPVFRFAPTPNGLLHLGHAYSAILNAQMAGEMSGRFLVRIEDTDTTRCSGAFAKQVFEDLAWLGLTWEKPVRYQSEHFAEYESSLQLLRAQSAIYPCFCTRREAQVAALATRDPDGQRHYSGACKNLSSEEADTRIAGGAPHGWRIDMQNVGTAEASVWGDTVIARRHGSSYHIAVVTDDALQGVTHIVRGRDIEAATPLHRLMQRLLAIPEPHYTHHALILDGNGQKLSKSGGSTALCFLRQEGVTPDDIRRRLGFT